MRQIRLHSQRPDRQVSGAAQDGSLSPILGFA